MNDMYIYIIYMTRDMIYVDMFIHIYIYLIYDILCSFIFYIFTPKKNHFVKSIGTRFRYRLLPAAGFGTGGQHRIVRNHVLFLLGQKKRLRKLGGVELVINVVSC